MRKVKLNLIQIGDIKKTKIGFFRRVHPEVVQWIPTRGQIIELNNAEADERYNWLRFNGYTEERNNYRKMYEDLLAEFEQYKKESIKWSVEDFTTLNHEYDDMHITEENAQKALEWVIRNHDCTIGVTWEKIREAYEMYAD